MISGWVKRVHLGDKDRAPHQRTAALLIFTGVVEYSGAPLQFFCTTNRRIVKKISIKSPISLDISSFCCCTRAFQVSKEYMFGPREWTFQRKMKAYLFILLLLLAILKFEPMKLFIRLWKRKLPLQRQSFCSGCNVSMLMVWFGTGVLVSYLQVQLQVLWRNVRCRLGLFQF